MTRFKLKETTLEVRDEQFVVRELTHAERTQWLKAARDDQESAPALLLSFGCVKPAQTIESVGEMPGAMVAPLFKAILEISGLTNTEDGEKKSDAR